MTDPAKLSPSIAHGSVIETEVLVIGGGATGTGIIRDLALRGIKSVLVEKDDIAYGTTGRNHGLLHSGARYAVKDLESAKECITENKILKKIARHTIEDTGGLFVTLPDDDPSYHGRLVEFCRIAGINAREITVREALRLEPNLNPRALGAAYVPDGTIDPFRLTAANAMDAFERGARLFTHTKAVKITKADGIWRTKCVAHNGLSCDIASAVIINAAGAWGERICSLAGISLEMYPAKGSMLIIDYRINRIVLNRCRPPSDADIIVPGDTVSLIGTTSKKVSRKEIDDLTVDDDEVDLLLREGELLIPGISKARALRAYSGVRPLVARAGLTGGREISRGIVLIDHMERDGAEGFITIAGGKLMTYRLMAERAVDLACKKLGYAKKCQTHRIPLPGSKPPLSKKNIMRAFSGLPNSVSGSTLYRHGIRAFGIMGGAKKNSGLACECEMVTEAEIEYAIKHQFASDIVDLRRRTRLGMGPCQGGLCAYRATGLFCEYGDYTPEAYVKMMRDFLEERWKGIKPILWGDALRESEFTYWIYEGLMGLGSADHTEKRKK